MKQVLLIELNEVNFGAVGYYIQNGKLPTFRMLIEKNGLTQTSSEENYEELEPWIQWVTAHTGLPLSKHGVFRLGDIVHHDLPQIWEILEAKGITVGAMSPMNAKNRTQNAAFFVPDPWTRTPVTGSVFLRKIYEALALAVNRNAEGKVGYSSLFWLLLGAARYAQPRNYAKYIKLATGSKTRSWAKALVLDLLLHDIFSNLMKRKKPDFATIFLNAAAHIQHHYMLSSPAYAGIGQNPAWYIAADMDPLLDVYELYDTILSQLIRDFPKARLMLATGLHQEPHSEVTYYWRLLQHSKFLEGIGVPFDSVEPRMSRDFLINCQSSDQAKIAEQRLSLANTNGLPLFEIDNRGKTLFVMFTYPHEIGESLAFSLDAETFRLAKKDIAFVAIKNGRHNGTGYFLDTATMPATSTGIMPLSSMPVYIEAALCA
jgi:hypothetical protein